MGEWLTRPAVADVAINKILANGTMVAGRGATFVNIHFAEIPHEACWTAGETHHILNASWPSRKCRLPPAGPAEWIWKNILFSIIYQKVQLFPPPLLFHSVAPSWFRVAGRKKTKPERFNRRVSEAGNKIQRSSCSSNIESICNKLTVSNIYF